MPAWRLELQRADGKLERRYPNGLSFSRPTLMGIPSITARPERSTDPAPQNARDLTAERGNSNYDIKQRFVVSSLCELPFNHITRLLGAIAHGWQTQWDLLDANGPAFHGRQ